MSDGYVVAGRVWPPRRRRPRRSILYLHGIQSHGGWFEHSASLLAEAGDAVILPDRRGSGLNKAARGDTPSMQRWLDDLDEIAAWAAGRFGPPRTDVVGVSWGGKLAAAWALRRPEQVVQLLLIAPGLYPKVDVGMRTRLAIGRCVVTRPRRRFEIPLSDPALFTDNPAGRAFIRDDPLKLSRATARFFWHSRKLDRLLLRAGHARLRTDATLLLAADDRIIRQQPTKNWFERATGGAGRVLVLPGTHTLEFAAHPDRFYQTLTSWVSQKHNPGNMREL